MEFFDEEAGDEMSSSVNTRIQELQHMHSQKLRTLLRSNDQLKKQMLQLKKEQKDNYRVKMIRNLRLKVRELESMNEVLKLHAMRKGATIEEIDDIYEGVLNEPKRARPVRTETLQREIAELKRENERLGKQLDALQSKKGKPSSSSSSSSRNNHSKTNVQHELDLLRSELAAKDEVIDIHKQMLQSVQNTNRALRGSKAKAQRSDERLEEMQEENARLKQELLTTVGQSEDNYQEIRMLRAQVSKLERSQDRREHLLEAKSSAKLKELNLQKDREAHLLAQIGLLKKDIQTAHEIAQWHKAQSARAGTEHTESLKHALIQAQNATKEREEEIRQLLNGQKHGNTQQQAFHTIDAENKRLHQVLGQMEAKLISTREQLNEREKEVLEKRTDVQRMEQRTRELARQSMRQVESLQGEVEALKAQLSSFQQQQHHSSSQRNSNDNTQTSSSIESLKIKFSQKLQHLHNKISDLENQLAEADQLSDRHANRNSELRKESEQHRLTIRKLQEEMSELDTSRSKAEEEAKYCKKWITKLKSCVTKLIAHISLLEHKLTEHEVELPPRPALVL